MYHWGDHIVNWRRTVSLRAPNLRRKREGQTGGSRSGVERAGGRSRDGDGDATISRGVQRGRRVHDDDPSRYLNDPPSDHDDGPRPDHDGDDHAPRGHNYDGRTYFYVLYSDFYFDYLRGDIYEYDGAYDLDNYHDPARGHDDHH